jgi:hypothetical protein
MLVVMQALIFLLILVVVLLALNPPVNGNELDKQIRILYRQTARYAVASLQDDSSVVKTLHANYAMGYLMAIKDIATTDQFKRATRDDLVAFERKIVAIQDASTVNLVGTCPTLIPNEDKMLLKAMYIKI